MLDAVLDEAARFTETVLAPLNDIGDRDRLHATTRPPATVTTPPGFKQAYAQFVDGGWTGLVVAGRVRRPGPAARRRACR